MHRTGVVNVDNAGAAVVAVDVVVVNGDAMLAGAAGVQGAAVLAVVVVGNTGPGDGEGTVAAGVLVKEVMILLSSGARLEVVVVMVVEVVVVVVDLYRSITSLTTTLLVMVTRRDISLRRISQQIFIVRVDASHGSGSGLLWLY